jgi:hypothetical protein
MIDDVQKWMIEMPEQLRRENTVGGDLKDLPCPFCHRPRSQRSHYIRCNPCGTNWFAGENFNKDPRIERFAKVIEEAHRNDAAKPKST